MDYLNVIEADIDCQNPFAFQASWSQFIAVGLCALLWKVAITSSCFECSALSSTLLFFLVSLCLLISVLCLSISVEGPKALYTL